MKGNLATPRSSLVQRNPWCGSWTSAGATLPKKGPDHALPRLWKPGERLPGSITSLMMLCRVVSQNIVQKRVPYDNIQEKDFSKPEMDIQPFNLSCFQTLIFYLGLQVYLDKLTESLSRLEVLLKLLFIKEIHGRKASLSPFVCKIMSKKLRCYAFLTPAVQPRRSTCFCYDNGETIKKILLY